MSSSMPSNLRIELASEDDIPHHVPLIIKTFSGNPIDDLLDHVDTPEAIEAATSRHLQAWREYQQETGSSCAIQCIHTDPESNERTMVACAQWYIYPTPRSAGVSPEYRLMAGEWVADKDQRRKAQDLVLPMLHKRNEWTAGRGHAIFMFMVTDKAWRRRGAATACVQWGIDRCRELGIMAYLEASKEGKFVYERLGFEMVDEVLLEIEGTTMPIATMIWWPPGTRNEDKKPLGGDR